MRIRTDRALRSGSKLTALVAACLLMSAAVGTSAVAAQSASSSAAQDSTGQNGEPSNGICERTPDVRLTIIAAIDEIDGDEDCHLVTDAHLAALTELTITEESGLTLRSGDLGGLTGLTTLRIRDNRGMGALPADVFEDLTALIFLQVANGGDSNGGLDSLPEDVFDGLTNLTTLDLNGNELSSLPEDVFDGLTSLEDLRLYGNDLSSLPEDVFDGLTSLTTLRLNANDLATLHENLFDGLAALTELNLSENELASLPSGIFGDLGQLEMLDLQHNSLQSLEAADPFKGLTSLTNVQLTQNAGSPFSLEVQLAEAPDGADGAVAVTTAWATPFDITVTLTATGGTVQPTTVTIPAGSTSAAAVYVSHSGSAGATVSIGSAAFPSDYAVAGYSGLGVTTGASLTITPTLPAITGVASVGQTLTADISSIDTGSEGTTTFSYQWLADDAVITDATASEYTLVAAQLGATIKVRVAFTDSDGIQQSLTSQATAAVTAGGV